MSNASPLMQAALLTQFGAPLSIAAIEQPALRPGQVLVRVLASGVNPLDTKIQGGNAAHAQARLPAILGIDLAGVVEAVAPGETRFLAGDEVYGMTGGIGGVPGSLAQFAAVDADLLAHKPRTLDMRQAAALPLIFITAWEGLVERARVQAGQKVLVHGGAGGVGHIAVQIARSLGAQVYATGSADQKALIESLGATAIDYRSQTVDDYVQQYTGGQGFDVIYDTVGGATLDASFAAARRYVGHVVSCLGWGAHKLAPLSFRGATYSGVFTLLPLLTGEDRQRHGQIMREAARMADAGQLRVLMDGRRFTLEQVNQAHALVAEGQARGKLVIDIGQ
ncbi:zinc-dependent alcohol dehydrogenase family protein [Herbaspirillum sp. NPDC087042]|uniref:zinc-dependent alcohol dehydrogenase family protein n=1 Tax=Herbaspirillum sp. NPDC087042 TaxID=3364004 RepID=UPI0038100E07